MARKKISEYTAKKILIGSTYTGVQINNTSRQNLLLKELSPKAKYVVKVDQGEKKRFKRGLIKIEITKIEIAPFLEELRAKGFSQFLIEEFVPHSGEYYLSFERTREGVKLLFSASGGVEIEGSGAKILQFILRSAVDLVKAANETNLELDWLTNIYQKFEDNYFSFLEINPLIIEEGSYTLLDCAVLVDDTSQFFVKDWSGDDFITDRISTPEEENVALLDANTPASLKLQCLNPNGSIGLLLSSGGASIVIADEIHAHGKASDIINYGEYSGGPSREETYNYSKNVLSLLLKSTANKKVLVIAGGVANFTDIYQTFMGVVDALTEVTSQLQKQKIKVFVRRGGPNEAKGLQYMQNFLQQNNLFGCVYGSDIEITEVINLASKHLAAL